MLRVAGVSIAGMMAVIGAVWSSGTLPELKMLPATLAQRRSVLMTELGRVSATGTGENGLLGQARALAARDPIDGAPFLVAGAIEEQGGRTARADDLYREALRRDPRSPGAHFMLAGRAIAKGNADLALRHLASLARQTQGAGPEFGKLMVAVANDPSLEPSVRRFLAREPRNRDLLFSAMAADPTLTERLFSLAGPSRAGSSPEWLPTLVRTEVMAGRADRAAAAWLRYGGGADPRRQGVRDGRFRLNGPPAPLGWTVLPSESGTVAASESGLEVDVYDHAAQALLTQWIFLPPGSYRIRQSASANLASRLEWRVACLGSGGNVIAVVPVGKIDTLTVPVGCKAQAIDLWTQSPRDDVAASTTGTIASLALERLK